MQLWRSSRPSWPHSVIKAYRLFYKLRQTALSKPHAIAVAENTKMSRITPQNKSFLRLFSPVRWRTTKEPSDEVWHSEIARYETASGRILLPDVQRKITAFITLTRFWVITWCVCVYDISNWCKVVIQKRYGGESCTTVVFHQQCRNRVSRRICIQPSEAWTQSEGLNSQVLFTRRLRLKSAQFHRLNPIRPAH